MLSAVESSIISSLDVLTAIAPEIRIAAYRGEFNKSHVQGTQRGPRQTALVDIHRLRFTRAAGRRLHVELQIRIYVSSVLQMADGKDIATSPGTNELWEACLGALTGLKVANGIHLTSLVPGKYTKVANCLTEDGHLTAVSQTFRTEGELTVPEPTQPETKGIELRYRFAGDGTDEVAKDILE